MSAATAPAGPPEGRDRDAAQPLEPAPDLAREERLQRRWRWVVTLAVLGILVVTLMPDEGSSLGVNWVPFEHHLRAFRALLRGGPNQEVIALYLLFDVVGNVLLFMPVGLAIAGTLGRRPFWNRHLAAVGFGALLSITVELIQLGMESRATDVDDVIFNSLGAWLGALLWDLTRRRKRRRTVGRP